MILSNGGATSVTILGEKVDDHLVIEKATTTTATGKKRSQVNGKRYFAKIGWRCTGTVYGQVTDLLTDQSFFYYYTPDTIPDYLSASDFPMVVDLVLTKEGHAGGGDKKYFLEIELSGVNLL